MMGGDYAPLATLEGVAGVLQQLGPDSQLWLIGDQTTIDEFLSRQGLKDDRLFVVHASEVIHMDENFVLKNDDRQGNDDYDLGSRTKNYSIL